MKKSLICVSALVAAAVTHSASAVSLALSDSISVAGNAVVITPDTDLPGDAANVSNGTSWDYIARERDNASQTNRRIVTFLEFDTSSLTVGDVTTPGFTATFTIDHVGHLNALNNGMDLYVGYNDSGAWDSSGTSDPLFAWAAASESQTILLEDVHTHSQGSPGSVDPPMTLTFDATSIVQGWVDGSINNQGLVLFGTAPGAAGNQSQASFLNNAALNTSVVPEPSALALLGLGWLPIVRRRR